MTQNPSKKIAAKQKKLYVALIGGLSAVIGAFLFMFHSEEEKQTQKETPKNTFDLVSQDVKEDNIRLSHLETINDVIDDRLRLLEKSIIDLTEENHLLASDKDHLSQETNDLKTELITLQQAQEEIKYQEAETLESIPSYKQHECEGDPFRSWEIEEKKEDRNILFEIPAGTVVKAVLVSGADCSVAIQKPTGPNMVLLRPLDNGKLPRNVKVPLKGSVIIGNALGDLASERVYIRAERMTLVRKNGDFVETEVSAYISGEDGREGMRGVVVDRSGSIIARAAFAAFLQGIGQGVQATLNNQTLEKLARNSADQTILNLDMVRSSAFQGGSTALSKLSDYYIKRAEQLQPAIQLAAGCMVDIVFTKTVKVGEKNLQQKLAYERELKRRDND